METLGDEPTLRFLSLEDECRNRIIKDKTPQQRYEDDSVYIFVGDFPSFIFIRPIWR